MTPFYDVIGNFSILFHGMTSSEKVTRSLHNMTSHDFQKYFLVVLILINISYHFLAICSENFKFLSYELHQHIEEVQSYELHQSIQVFVLRTALLNESFCLTNCISIFKVCLPNSSFVCLTNSSFFTYELHYFYTIFVCLSPI